MITKQQIRINYRAEISIKTHAKKIKIITHQKNCRNLSANSLAMITKQQIRINYIKDITFKSDAKEHKY